MSGLDLLIHACEESGFQIQTVDELRGDRGRKRTRTKEVEVKSKRKLSTTTAGDENARALQLTNRSSAAVANKMSTTMTTTRELEGEELARAADALAESCPEIVLERAKQWIDFAVADVRARLAALKRSRRRTQGAFSAHSTQIKPV